MSERTVRMRCPVFGGFFLSEAEAGHSMPFGCPPLEILEAYAIGKPFSSVSGTDIARILPKLHEHIKQCEAPAGRCYEYVLLRMETRNSLQSDD